MGRRKRFEETEEQREERLLKEREEKLRKQRDNQRAWRAANREASLARGREYDRRPGRRAAKNARERERRQDPAYRAAMDEARRQRHIDEYVNNAEKREAINRARRKRLPPGHTGNCDCCGVFVPLRSNGRTGLNEDHRHDTGEVRGWICHRCNLQVAILDLRFSDPDRFALLMAWSNRMAPMAPMPALNKRTRKQFTPNPTLLDLIPKKEGAE